MTAWVWEYEVWKDWCKFCKAHSFLFIIRGSDFTPQHLSATEEVVWQEGNGVKKQISLKTVTIFPSFNNNLWNETWEKKFSKWWSPMYLNSQRVTLEKQ